MENVWRAVGGRLRLWTMRTGFCLSWMLALGVISAGAQQVSVEVTTFEKTYLPEEDLVIAIRVTNFSGKKLTFTSESDWLHLNVTTSTGMPVAQIAEPVLKGEFSLETSQAGTRRVNLVPGFRLDRPGSYRVTAKVKLAELGLEATSEPASFSIVSGRVLWEQTFGMSGGKEVRKYSLIQSTQKSSIHLYVKVSDAADQMVARVFPISPLTSFSRPEPQIDRNGSLHVLNQYAARSFHHCLIGPDGTFLLRHHYDYGTQRPVLRPDASGDIVVDGGRRRRLPSDIEPPGAAAEAKEREKEKKAVDESGVRTP